MFDLKSVAAGISGITQSCGSNPVNFCTLKKKKLKKIFDENCAYMAISYCLFLIVPKVKNKLDGREYAVKKIPLKETNPDLWLKVNKTFDGTLKVAHFVFTIQTHVVIL